MKKTEVRHGGRTRHKVEETFGIGFSTLEKKNLDQEKKK